MRGNGEMTLINEKFACRTLCWAGPRVGLFIPGYNLLNKYFRPLSSDERRPKRQSHCPGAHSRVADPSASPGVASCRARVLAISRVPGTTPLPSITPPSTASASGGQVTL